MKLTFLFALFCCISLPALAEVRLPNLFGDHMILQQETSNAIWGWAEPGETVTVEASWGTNASTKADNDGKWMLFLETPAFGTRHTLTIRAENEITISDVAIGEVWLCAGQSNMGWSTGNSFEAEGEAEVSLPDLRLFRSAREHWHEPLDENRDRLARWKPCDPESAAETSAVSYYFGKTLHQELGVPVGIIQRAYAGTPIEGWMPWELQQNDLRALAHREELDASATRQRERQGESTEQALATFGQELADYDALIDAGETMKNGARSLSPPIITRPADLGHQYPQHIYNAMIVPVRPYGIRGMIWYQGERNSKNAPQAAHYRQQLATMIGHFRESWHQESNGHVADSFPFQLTQLPSWNSQQTEPVEGVEASWAVNRESMRLAAQEIPNIGVAVTIDTGDAVELHPKNKKPIGIRHALLALESTYGKEVVGSGPQFQNHEIADGQVTLRFDSMGGGLSSGRDGKLDAFAVAGQNQEWHWAEAEIKGDSVIVQSGSVPDPVAVRYAWAMNPSGRNLLYNRDGLPASPFRTDEWPLFDPDAELVEVHKPEKPSGYVSSDWARPAMIAVEDPADQRPATTLDEPASMEKSADGLAPEVTDFNAADASKSLEDQLPYLETPFINPAPNVREDGIPVGRLTRRHGDRRAILTFAQEIAQGNPGNIDSFLLMKDGKLLFESYYRRGRANFPHYQMSITKSYTAMALGRAIQLGHLSTGDLDRPVVSFLDDLDSSRFVEGVDRITLAEALNMHSGIRVDEKASKKLREGPGALKGQGQIQAYFENSAPIPSAPREYKYQGSDPSMVMQVIDSVVPGTAWEFIENELLGKMGITDFAWQEDVSALPKAAAGSSMRSRDMLKWGMLVMNQGKWNGEQLIPAEFVKQATDRIYTNPQGTSYGYFWWRHDMEVGDRKIDCISGRGAGGQFIFLFPELNLISVVTSHNKGMGEMLKALFPERVLSALLVD
ncbi:MAG: sialate O-acetylesterase [Verrucomicrobiota bacterium]